MGFSGLGILSFGVAYFREFEIFWRIELEIVKVFKGLRLRLTASWGAGGLRVLGAKGFVV